LTAIPAEPKNQKRTSQDGKKKKKKKEPDFGEIAWMEKKCIEIRKSTTVPRRRRHFQRKKKGQKLTKNNI
jgi:hypothetical protein